MSKISQNIIQTVLWYYNQCTILLLWPAMQKNAKMRKNENSRNLSKIEWPPVQSLLVLGYWNFTKNCSITLLIGIQRDFLIFPLWKKITVSLKCLKTPQNGQFWEFDEFLGVKKIVYRSKIFSLIYSLL